MTLVAQEKSSKVPQITLVFWIIKIAATTLGETAGDALSMSAGFGYFHSTLIFAAILGAAIAVQILAKQFHPVVYWTTIIATTTVGTTLADFFDRSLGIGYAGGSSLLLILLMGILFLWHHTVGSVSVTASDSPQAEIFYWLAIIFSQTLGTALGDWTADSMAFGYAGSSLIFSALLALVAAGYYRSTLSRTLLFWVAFILTRPLGAVLGDWLDKPLDSGGLALSRYVASIVLLLFIAALVAIFPQKAASPSH